MKKIGTVIVVIVLCCLSFLASQAFSQQLDIVRLKNGSVIKGTIVELIPDKTVKIETSDGSIFVYNLSEVEKIEKEQFPEKTNVGQNPRTRGRQSGPPKEFVKKNSVTISAGVSLPVGDFSEQAGSTAGAAQTGFALGVDGSVGIAPELSWMATLNLSINSMDVSSATSPGISSDAGSWSSVWLLTGLKAGGPAGPNVEFFGFGEVGLLFSSSPEIHLYSGSNYSTLNSASATTFGYSVGTGMNIGQFGISLRYLHGEPEFNLTATGSAGTASGTGKQSISIIQILGSVSF